MDVEEKLATIEDTKAFLRAAGCRMMITPAPKGAWSVQIMTATSALCLAAEVHEDFAIAIRKCCAKAMAELAKVKSQRDRGLI